VAVQHLMGVVTPQSGSIVFDGAEIAGKKRCSANSPIGSAGE
jgi:hypothetical protein